MAARVPGWAATQVYCTEGRTRPAVLAGSVGARVHFTKHTSGSQRTVTLVAGSSNRARGSILTLVVRAWRHVTAETSRAVARVAGAPDGTRQSVATAAV